MQVFSTIVIQFILLLYTTNYVISLKCYQCNSHNDNACNSITDSRERPKECPPHLQASCKTIVQEAPYMYSHNVTNRPTVRIYRDCSAISPEFPQCIDRVGTDKVKMRYCICTDDACNQSVLTNSVQVKSILISTAFSILIYLFSLN
ncbi:hypothetical protein MS3_00009602 [Schistosoma haematobium]|uniref:Protein sleepless n=1 Tax=Schistosoma haematobium TaxID=6185 RepID=A0A922IHM4_SCHHA|nr:hypothetical protein MS3_00009602 [Schistosoma haematobium]KAH9579463.1 hypothetical protein MS3_00009602 [Schistosoma haematobium]CAH8634302.1 unnamed protein product [Schistosoma haematobium]CAH8640982.1 unnamed protein product [Schistosoma haematobium]